MSILYSIIFCLLPFFLFIVHLLYQTCTASSVRYINIWRLRMACFSPFFLISIVSALLCETIICELIPLFFRTISWYGPSCRGCRAGPFIASLMGHACVNRPILSSVQWRNDNTEQLSFTAKSSSVHLCTLQHGNVPNNRSDRQFRWAFLCLTSCFGDGHFTRSVEVSQQ